MGCAKDQGEHTNASTSNKPSYLEAKDDQIDSLKSQTQATELAVLRAESAERVVAELQGPTITRTLNLI